MDKQLLLKNILIELNRLPVSYLPHWYDLIHTFRENLQVEEDISGSSTETDFDWDALVDEVMKNRQRNNLRRFQLTEIPASD